MPAPAIGAAAVKARLRELLSEALDEDVAPLQDDTTAGDVEGWDSLAHLKLVVAIEEEWRIRFDIAELDAPRNVGELVDMIVRKAGG